MVVVVVAVVAVATGLVAVEPDWLKDSEFVIVASAVETWSNEVEELVEEGGIDG